MNSKPLDRSAKEKVFNYRFGLPGWAADFRCYPEDFVVDECLGFEPQGAGEHLLLQVRKTNQNTRWVAKLLADYFNVDDREVGYCGLKDRRAVTSQWFSVPFINIPVDPESLQLEGCDILQVARHNRKLRPGMHRDNSFVIRLRNLVGCRDDVESRLQQIAESGVPNYFGEQRFGIERGNLDQVAEILSRPRPRFKGRRGGLYLSAARSWLFNLVLSERVGLGNWRRSLEGEDQPQGPLWGRGRPGSRGELATLENRVLERWSQWCNALEHSGLSQERRALVLMPVNFRWSWTNTDLVLGFTLPPGTYATAILRELAVLNEPEPVL